MGRMGNPETPADKHRAVERLLSDPEWSAWSNREIARRVGVSDPFVMALLPKLSANVSSENRTYITKHGTTATLNTANFGKSPSPTPSVMVPPNMPVIERDDSDICRRAPIVANIPRKYIQLDGR